MILNLSGFKSDSVKSDSPVCTLDEKNSRSGGLWPLSALNLCFLANVKYFIAAAFFSI